MRSLVLLIFVGLAGAEIYQRCNWARVLKYHGMDNYRGYSLANWVCLTKWESHYNTEAINHNTDRSTDYGIFQINSRWWCDDGSIHSSNGCNIRCSELLTNDVSVAITCAKRVVMDPNGMAAWVAWRRNCKGRDLSSYLSGCDV